MEEIEYITWCEQLKYWELRVENAELEHDYLLLKIQKLKDE